MNHERTFVTPAYLRRTAEVLRTMKERTYALMRLGPGSRALDLGCGPGEDTIPMARLVGRTGLAAGLDNDPAMLAEAEAYANREGLGQTAGHLLGDALHPPFAAESFDAVRAERLFQTLPPEIDRMRVLGAMLALLKTGGRMVAADADWGAASLDYPDADLERRLTRFFAMRLRPDGFAGRRLYGQFKRLGLAEVTVELFPVAAAHVADTVLLGRLVEAAATEGVATAGELAAWSGELTRRSERGEFYCSVNMVIAAGTKPKS